MSNQNLFDLFNDDPIKSTLLQTKANLQNLIIKELKSSGLKQKEVAKLLNLTKPRVSNLYNCYIDKFSIDAMLEILFRLNYAVKYSSTSSTPFVLVKKSGN